MSDTEIEELAPSELGTKNYWDRCYNNELDNFTDHGDVGEVWFGEDSAARVIDWVAEHKEAIPSDSHILDVGCGNGMMCIDLAREGFTNVTGVDYSENAVLLARKVAEQAGVKVDYEKCDILEDLTTTSNAVLKRKWSVVVDKGTFDAISLNEDAKSQKKTYVKNIATLLSDNGLLILTSCNWTEEEILAQFKQLFSLHSEIPTPSFSFGGKTGNLVTSIVLRKQ